MSVFNPQVAPTQDPNYMGYARVVEAPSPDVSSKIALETAGAGLEGAVGVVDSAIKKGIQNKAYSLIDPERDRMTTALETVKAQTATSEIAAPVLTASGGATVGKSLLDANASMDTEVPTGVENGLDRIDQLKQAQKAAKINDTQYSGNVLSIAKQLRAQYPGYREYIDEQVSKISGLPVANAYYQNLMTDINRQLVMQAGSKDKVEALYLKNLDVPQIQNYWRAFKEGKMEESTFIGKIADWQNFQTQQKIDAAKRAESTDNRTVQIQTAESQFTSSSNNAVNLHVKDITTLSGMSSLGALMRYFDDVSAGRIKQTDAEVDQRTAQLATYRNVIYRQLKEQAADVEPLIGNDKSEKIIKSAMSPIDTMIEFAKSKETGPGFFHARQIEAIKNDDAHGWLVSKDRGALSRQLMTARTILGEQYFPDYIRSIMSNNVDKPLKDVFEQEAMNAISPIADARGTPVPRYMKDAFKQGAKIGASSESGWYGSVTSLVTKISDPKVSAEAKDQLIDWAFNPEKNKGILDQLKMDYIDPNTGQNVPGKYRAFNIMSSSAITTAVADSAKINPENYVKYQSHMEGEFGRLFRVDVLNLTKAVKASRDDVRVVDGVVGKSSFAVHYSWDEANNKLGLVDDNNRPVTRDSPKLLQAKSVNSPTAGYVLGALDVLDRVNGGLGNLANIQKNNPQEKEDTSTYLFKVLNVTNFRTDADIRGASEIQKAIVKSRQPDMKNEDLDKMFLKKGVIKGNLSDQPEGNPVSTN